MKPRRRRARRLAAAARAEGAIAGETTRRGFLIGRSRWWSVGARDVEHGAANPFDGALTELDDASDEEDVPPAGSKSKSTTLNAGKRAGDSGGAARPRRGRAVAPLSRAFTLAVADSLPSHAISQPLRAIRALVLESKRGLPSRRDVRVAVVARALAAHAARARRAIVVMTPLGESSTPFLRMTAPRATANANETPRSAPRAAGIGWTWMT